MPRTKKEAQDARAPARTPRTSARTKRTARPEAASQNQLAVESTLAAAAAALRSPTEEALNSCADDHTETESCTCGCGCGCHSAGAKDDECLLPSDDVEILSAFFKALSDPSRLNIVCVLLKYQQLSVGDIAAKINMSVSAVSHQLAILRMRKLVKVTRDGVKNYYALCDSHVAQVIETAIEHINE